jgi:hypothetical protein
MKEKTKDHLKHVSIFQFNHFYKLGFLSVIGFAS